MLSGNRKLLQGGGPGDNSTHAAHGSQPQDGGSHNHRGYDSHQGKGPRHPSENPLSPAPLPDPHPLRKGARTCPHNVHTTAVSCTSLAKSSMLRLYAAFLQALHASNCTCCQVPCQNIAHNPVACEACQSRTNKPGASCFLVLCINLSLNISLYYTVISPDRHPIAYHV